MSEMRADLIAPCGMNCRLCIAYIRPKKPCNGCNGDDANKPYHCVVCKIKSCEAVRAGEAGLCSESEKTCRRLKDLDKRYKAKYHMSMLANLGYIRDNECGFSGAKRRAEMSVVRRGPQRPPERLPGCGHIVFRPGVEQVDVKRSPRIATIRRARGAPDAGRYRAACPLLTEKDAKVRYPAFLILCERSKTHPDAYPYWDVFAAKLGDENSFQRNIGASLIGYNVRWDTDKKFKDVFRRFTRLFTDEKPITARLVLQTIPTWAEHVPELLTDTFRF
jgi:hypothetical protein